MFWLFLKECYFYTEKTLVIISRLVFQVNKSESLFFRLTETPSQSIPQVQNGVGTPQQIKVEMLYRMLLIVDYDLL